jgi:putative membrane protein insertion efficiency factor
MTRFALALIAFYRRRLSPKLPAMCRYTPTCSAYAEVAYRRYGFFWGSLLAGKRVMSCNPLGGHGHQPVPPRKDGKPDRSASG